MSVTKAVVVNTLILSFTPFLSNNFINFFYVILREAIELSTIDKIKGFIYIAFYLLSDSY